MCITSVYVFLETLLPFSFKWIKIIIITFVKNQTISMQIANSHYPSPRDYGQGRQRGQFRYLIFWPTELKLRHTYVLVEHTNKAVHCTFATQRKCHPKVYYRGISDPIRTYVYHKQFLNVSHRHTHMCMSYFPLVPLFQISGDISSGFQSQSEFCLIRF